MSEMQTPSAGPAVRNAGAAAGVVDEAVVRARRLEADAGFPRRYVEQVRAATGWLGIGPSSADDVRHASLLLSRQSAIDLEPPTAARGPARRLVKLAVRRLLGWYVRFLAQQVAAIGQASARLGFATAGRLDAIDAGRAALEDEVAALRARVADLESRLARGDTAGRAAGRSGPDCAP